MIPGPVSIADKFRFNQNKDILSEIDEEKRYDLYQSDRENKRTPRLSKEEPLFCSAAHTLCIDHHVQYGSLQKRIIYSRMQFLVSELSIRTNDKG